MEDSETAAEIVVCALGLGAPASTGGGATPEATAKAAACCAGRMTHAHGGSSSDMLVRITVVRILTFPGSSLSRCPSLRVGLPLFLPVFSNLWIQIFKSS